MNVKVDWRHDETVLPGDMNRVEGNINELDSGQQALDAQHISHIGNFNNPHNVTSTQLGLGNVLADLLAAYDKIYALQNTTANINADLLLAKNNISSLINEISSFNNQIANLQYLYDAVYDVYSGTLTIIRSNGTTLTANIPIAHIDLDYDTTTREFIFTRADGTQNRISVSNFVPIYHGSIGTHIQIEIVPDGELQRIHAILRAHSITRDKIVPGTITGVEIADGSISASKLESGIINTGTITGVTAGNGVTGGGTHGAVVMALGEPSSITSVSTNSVDINTHSHELSNGAITRIKLESALTEGFSETTNRAITNTQNSALFSFRGVLPANINLNNVRVSGLYGINGSSSNGPRPTNATAESATLLVTQISGTRATQLFLGAQNNLDVWLRQVGTGATPWKRIDVNGGGTITGITAGDGLMGGGTSGAITVTLGIPETLSAISKNSVSTESHAHEISGFDLAGSAAAVQTAINNQLRRRGLDSDGIPVSVGEDVNTIIYTTRRFMYFAINSPTSSGVLESNVYIGGVVGAPSFQHRWTDWATGEVFVRVLQQEGISNWIPWRKMHDSVNLPVESGTWNPVVMIGGIERSWNMVGTYKRFGNYVSVEFGGHRLLIAEGETGNIFINGVPFMSHQGTSGFAYVPFHASTSDVSSVGISIQPWHSHIIFRVMRRTQTYSYDSLDLFGEDLPSHRVAYIGGKIEYKIA